jgi:phosphonate transport system substrate-binding protein
MMPFKKILPTICVVFLIFANSPALTVALKPDKNPGAMAEERGRLEDFLSSRLGVVCKVVVPMSAAVIHTGLDAGTIDVAFVSATDLLIVENKYSAKFLASVLVDGSATYRSLWLVRAEDPAIAIADLRGHKIAFSSRTSTSGYIVPMRGLYLQGFLRPGQQAEEFFGAGNVVFSTGYVGAVELLLTGDVRAAAVSDYVYHKDKHLNSDQKSRLRVLAEAGRVPVHVLAASGATPKELLSQFLGAILELNHADHAALRDAVFGGEITTVRDVEAHEQLKSALIELKILE